MRKRSRRFESPPMEADGNWITFFERLVNRAPEGQPPNEVWIEFVRIENPGDRKTIPEFQLDDTRRQKYHEAYARWQKSKTGGEGEIYEGTLLEDWMAISIEQVEGLRDHRIFTVEMLAAITDANIGALGPGGRLLREKAREFILAKRRAAPIDELRNELAAVRAELAAARSQPTAAPAADMQATIEAAVAKALASRSKAGGRSRSKSHSRPKRREVAETPEIIA